MKAKEFYQTVLGICGDSLLDELVKHSKSRMVKKEKSFKRLVIPAYTHLFWFLGCSGGIFWMEMEMK